VSEKECLDAAKGAIEALFSVSLGELHRTDLTGGSGKAAEGAWSTQDGSHRFVIEHTSVDLFEGQRKISEQFDATRKRLEQDIVLADPDSRITVKVTTGFLGRRYRKSFSASLKQVADKVNEVLKEMRPGEVRQLEFPEWSTTLSIESREYYNPGTGYLAIVPALTPELGQTRLQRFQRAINEKCPKLLLAAGENTTTVLVLEDVDPYHSAFQNFRDMFEHLALSASQLPDVVLYASSDTNKVAELCQMKIGDRWLDYTETTNFLKIGTRR